MVGVLEMAEETGPHRLPSGVQVVDTHHVPGLEGTCQGGGSGQVPRNRLAPEPVVQGQGQFGRGAGEDLGRVYRRPPPQILRPDP